MFSTNDYFLIQTESELATFESDNKNIAWMALDTEFIGEKRYQTLLCLIQIATQNGLYVFDTLKLRHIQPILDLLVRPDILKITHAGENDYRLINELYRIFPVNVFDTQIAAGFLGYKFPLSFRKLVEEELGIRLSKDQTVTDWELRPMKKGQIQYALEDVIPLYNLWQQLSQKINTLQRTDWVKEEIQRLEQESFYEKNPHKEALGNSLILSLSKREQVFLIRLYEWRRHLAEERNHSKEMVLAGKNIAPIVKAVGSGVEGLKNNRRISERFVERYGEEMVKLHQNPITPEETKLLKEIKELEELPPKEDLRLELLYSFMVYRCLEAEVAADLVIPRAEFKKMKFDSSYITPALETGWRRNILGEDILLLLKHRTQLIITSTSISLSSQTSMI